MMMMMMLYVTLSYFHMSVYLSMCIFDDLIWFSLIPRLGSMLDY